MQRADQRSLRRLAFSFLVALTVLFLTAQLIYILSAASSPVISAIIITAFLINVTWISIVFWNAVIGFAYVIRDRIFCVSPLIEAAANHAVIAERVAIVVTVRDDDPRAVSARLNTIKKQLDRTEPGQMFDYFVLSDSSVAGAIAAEEDLFTAPAGESQVKGRIVYRRREVNSGFKPGNVRDFCERWGKQYALMVLLDADSFMSGKTILHLVKLMQENPYLGILQSLIVGILSPTFFARVYEFGHRHGLRCSIVGAAWWQVDRCQYWGHNAVVRLQPFVKFCEMPFIPGKGPFSGHVISHDQIEASFMHRAGYEVRTFPQESGSYEGVPPTIFEFMSRNHRWCQGNFKNLKLVAAFGLALIDRVHLTMVAQRFIAWPALVVVVAFSAVLIRWFPILEFDRRAALILYAEWLLIFFAPRLLGLAEALVHSASRYGGSVRLLLSGGVETLFFTFLSSISMVAATAFMIRLMFGYEIVWSAQRRSHYTLTFREAFRRLWLETTVGVALMTCLAASNYQSLIWFGPFWIPLVLAAPFAVVTALPSMRRWAERNRICAIPEEIDPPSEMRELAQRLSARYS